MEELAVEEVWERAAQLLDVRGIPHPQMVVATGRGLQLLWLYRKGQPAQIAPRWMAVQRELIELFSDFGPDGSASRLGGVLRLPGTVNQKSGVRSHFVHFDPDTRFDFEDLQRAILPVPRPKYVREPSRNDQRARSAKPPPQAEANRRMASLVVQDIERLMQGRGPGYRRETSCDASLFIYGHYLLRAVGRNVFWERFMTCARAIGDVSVEQRRAIAKSVIAFKHRYSTEGAAADLGVTEDEVHKFKLQRLQPAGEKNDREKRQRHLERGRQQKAGARRAQGHRPQTESLSATKPWALMGVSRSTYYRHCTKT
jgi:hypothetical protein